MLSAFDAHYKNKHDGRGVLEFKLLTGTLTWLVSGVEVHQSWASIPFAYPNIFFDRHVNAILGSEYTNIDTVRVELNLKETACSIDSAKSRVFYAGEVTDLCWSGQSLGGRDDFHFVVTEDLNTLHYRQRYQFAKWRNLTTVCKEV